MHGHTKKLLLIIITCVITLTSLAPVSALVEFWGWCSMPDRGTSTQYKRSRKLQVLKIRHKKTEYLQLNSSISTC